ATAVSVNPRLRRSVRRAYATSLNSESIEILSYGRSARARSVPEARSFKVLNVLDEPSVGVGRLFVRGIRDSACGQSVSRIRTPDGTADHAFQCPPRCRDGGAFCQ